MTPAEFRTSLGAEAPPPGLAPALAALWWAGRDGIGAMGPGWERAHALTQEADDRSGDRDAAWVHAHLHRIEGDPGNAAYWYARADRPVEAGPLAAEWDAIAAALLAQR